MSVAISKGEEGGIIVPSKVSLEKYEGDAVLSDGSILSKVQ